MHADYTCMDTHMLKKTHTQTWSSSTPVSVPACAVDNVQLQASGRRNLPTQFSTRLALFIDTK